MLRLPSKRWPDGFAERLLTKNPSPGGEKKTAGVNLARVPCANRSSRSWTTTPGARERARFLSSTNPPQTSTILAGRHTSYSAGPALAIIGMASSSRFSIDPNDEALAYATRVMLLQKGALVGRSAQSRRCSHRADAVLQLVWGQPPAP